MSLTAISPIDGRYASKVADLIPYYSEFALIKYRVRVEIEYLLALADIPLPQLKWDDEQKNKIRKILEEFSLTDAEQIKETERTTNHDVKAVEYFIKDKMKAIGLADHVEFVHFALTSQDINNTALPLMIKESIQDVMLPLLNDFNNTLRSSAHDWWDIPMLARTHGQPASPTSIGKEMMVFVDRLEHQISQLNQMTLMAKFGGATGQFNAHIATYPQINWEEFADHFIEKLGISRARYTTQIGHYDDHSEVFDLCSRINNILIDLSRDIWTYISINYFGQKTIKNEVGSSAMPHKVNPIDFENAEGNLMLSHALFQFLSHKLPISRLQRDLTDSTVSRNIGVPFGHMVIALKSLQKGWGKLKLNLTVLNDDLEDNWAVVSEAIQNILRREQYDQPYEALKALTRGKARIEKKHIHDFIQTLNVSESVKEELLSITPQNYIGYIGIRSAD